MNRLRQKLENRAKRIKQPIKAYLKASYVPSIGKWDTKRTRALKISIYISIGIAVFFALFGALHLLYAAKLFATYPMPMLDNNYALELSILGAMYGCFSLAFWGFQYVINYYRSRWLDPDATEIIDEQHYMKFHGWSHIVLAMMLMVGISLLSVELLTYQNMENYPKSLDQLKLAMILLVMIYGTCRIQAHRFKEYLDMWKNKK